MRIKSYKLFLESLELKYLEFEPSSQSWISCVKPPKLYKLKKELPNFEESTYVMVFDNWEQEVSFQYEIIGTGIYIPSNSIMVDKRDIKRRIKVFKDGDIARECEPFTEGFIKIPGLITEYKFLDFFE